MMHAAIMLDRFGDDVVRANTLTDRALYPAPTIRGQNAQPCQTMLARPTGMSSFVDNDYNDLGTVGYSTTDSLTTRLNYCGDSGLPAYDDTAFATWTVDAVQGSPLTGGDWKVSASTPFRVGLVSQASGPNARRINAALSVLGYVERVGTETRASIDPPGPQSITSYRLQQRNSAGTDFDNRGSFVLRPRVLVSRDAQGVRRMTGSIEFALEGVPGAPLGRGLGYFVPTNPVSSVQYGAVVQFDATTTLRVDSSAMANSMRAVSGRLTITPTAIVAGASAPLSARQGAEIVVNITDTQTLQYQSFHTLNGARTPVSNVAATWDNTIYNHLTE